MVSYNPCAEGLADEVCALKQVARPGLGVAGRHNDGDVRPVLGRVPGQGEAIHLSRHLNVGELHAEVRMALVQQADGRVGMGCLQGLEPGILQDRQGVHADERVVVHDEGEGGRG